MIYCSIILHTYYRVVFRDFHLHHLLIWPNGHRNESIHNTFIVKAYRLLSPWFTFLHFDLCETDPSCYDQMTILARYIFHHKNSINNVITLLFHLFKKTSHQNHFTSLVCELSIFIRSHQPSFYLCASHQIVRNILFISQGAVTTKTSPVNKKMIINWLYVRYLSIYK